MRPLVLLWGCLVLPGYGALVGPKEIRGFEGDTVSLQCTYGEELRKNKKYWCKKRGFFISRCSKTIYAGEDGQERTVDRVSIQDNPQDLSFNVTLRKLTLQDAGSYWCGIKLLGFDETFPVSLLVFPGPCCPPSPPPSFQPLATSLGAKAKAWQTQLPELTSPGLHSTVTTAKQGKTEAEAFPVTGTSLYDYAGPSLYTGTSPSADTSAHTVTSPNEETSPHKATSPHAGTSHPATPPDATSTEDTSLVHSSSSSKPRVSLPMVRILAPVLVLLTLLLAAGLAILGRYMLQWRKKAQLAMETQRNEKVHLSHLPLGNSLVPEYAVVNLAAPMGPHASATPSTSPCTETRCRNQTSEEEEAPFQDPERDRSPGPPLHMSEEELMYSKFISV